MSSSTFSVPKRTTRPTSLRARSTSMMCSASSLGSSASSPSSKPVVLLVLPAGPRAGDRPRDHDAVAQAHHRLGRRPDDRHLGEAQEVQVGARVEQAQGAVDVERIGLEHQVVALREHHLEDVTGPDVLLGRVDRRLVLRRASSSAPPSAFSSPAGGAATISPGPRAGRSPPPARRRRAQAPS